ncbi:unnamed protein product [Acanthoscelides obtectus]|uniref:PiggyBac transposable element-derived protein domain-containing protein n=1 Tax=Acanthoscelides obtectus TaxID=200917 RepID=A0A9P0Q567_ACAOB|nr:unnamed protein product [Acanthoscelides obtectus]CAK1675217.1 PiggyBac transposable element-derived protein 3 [Acanthoscelides obtectus]
MFSNKNEASGQVSRAEIKIAALISEHNLPIKLCDHLIPLLKDIFLDSKIAQGMQMGRTKATGVIKHVLAKSHFEELIEELKAKKFSILVDESTDIGIQQIVEEATHITNTSATLIDVILCNDPSMIESKHVGGLDLTDHELISCKLRLILNFMADISQFLCYHLNSLNLAPRKNVYALKNGVHFTSRISDDLGSALFISVRCRYGFCDVSLAIFGNKRVLRPGEDDEKLEQILQLIANDDSDVEMSDDENEIENMDNLVPREDEINDEDLVSSSDEEGEDRIPLSVLREKLRTAKQTPNSSQRQFWRRNDTFTPPNFEGPSSECSAQLRDGWTAKSYFAMYLEDDMFQKVCDCTNARIRMYWAKPTRVAAIADIMTRDRFFSIRSNLKVVIDGSISEEKRRYDKFWKVRPILEAVLQGCLQLPREKVVAVDEQMIPFTGTCQMKQFVRGKPNPEGLKNFVVAAPDGLVVDFELYQGKNTFPDDSVKRLGVGPSAVVRLGRTLFPGTHVYCDRYFTTIPLLEYLRQQKKYCTGTIMKSRVPAAAHLTSDKMMAKIGRGSSEQIVRQDGEIVVVQWYDLKSVLLASTRLGIQPSDECKRWSKKDPKYIQVATPYIVAKYNDCMGGIDLIDRMISYYTIQARSKKWTLRIYALNSPGNMAMKDKVFIRCYTKIAKDANLTKAGTKRKRKKSPRVC